MTQEEAENILKKEQLEGEDLEKLLEARKLNLVSFVLMDVREPIEYQMYHIVGTDALVPTSRFYSAIEDYNDKKLEPIILYCHTGNRSYHVQQAMKSLGFKSVGNLTYGIVRFNGDIKRG